MGWTNSHHHRFEINDERYGDPELLDDGFEDDEDVIDSLRTKISETVPKSGKRFRFLYEYDFGDGWHHVVRFEGCLPAENGQRYPICVEGERACLPEDVGGIRDYLEFLEALANPANERHDEFVRWAGRFDPEKFDAGSTLGRGRR